MTSPTLTELPSPPPGKTGWPWTIASPQLPNSMPDDQPWPKVTIVTPSYNQGHYIEETIRSVLLQGYPNLEYIILDGGSTDNSVEIIRKYAPWLAYWVSEKDKGQSDAINNGLNRGTGDILTWLNSDDYFLPETIQHVIDSQQQHPTASAWVGGCYRIDPQGYVINTVWPHTLDRESLADWGFNRFYQPSCFFAAWAWQKVGPLDETLHYVFDFDLWLKLAAVGDFVLVPKILSSATIHEEAKTQTQRPKMFAETGVVQTRHGYEALAVKRLADLMIPPSWHRQAKAELKRMLRPVVRPLMFWKRLKRVRYVDFLSENR